MRDRSNVGMYCCIAPANNNIRTSALSMSNINMDFKSPLVIAAWLPTPSFGCASYSSSNVDLLVFLPLIPIVSPVLYLHD